MGWCDGDIDYCAVDRYLTASTFFYEVDVDDGCLDGRRESLMLNIEKMGVGSGSDSNRPAWGVGYVWMGWWVVDIVGGGKGDGQVKVPSPACKGKSGAAWNGGTVERWCGETSEDGRWEDGKMEGSMAERSEVW